MPQARLRVTYVDHVARVSGGEIALLRLLPALDGLVDAHVILGEAGPLVARLQEAGVSVEIMPLDERIRDARRGAISLARLEFQDVLGLLRYVFHLRSRLQALRPDLVHTNSLKAALYGGLAGRLAGVPVVWHIRDRIADDYLPRRLVRIVRLAARILPTRIIANSEATLSTLGVPTPASVVYNVIPVDSRATPRQYGHRSDGLRVGILGRLAEWKGQHVFLEAFSQAFPERGTAWIIGAPLFGEEGYERALVLQAERLGISDRIVWRGFRDDIAAELAHVDILVHCSTVPEPFGQAVIEGMAAGLPVIAAAAGGPLEIIDDGNNGLLTPPGDVMALASSLRTLGGDAALRRKIGCNALMASRRFTGESAAPKIMAAYRSALKS